MRLHGPSIADIGGNGEYQFTCTLGGLTEIGLSPSAVRLALHLFEVLSYPDPVDGKKVTTKYKSEFDFAVSRIKWAWSRTGLSKAKKELKRAGLLKVVDDDWFLDINVIPRNALTSKRRQVKPEPVDVPVDDQPAEASQAATTTVEVKAIKPSTAQPFNPEPQQSEMFRSPDGRPIRSHYEDAMANYFGNDTPTITEWCGSLAVRERCSKNPPLTTSYEQWDKKQQQELLEVTYSTPADDGEW